MLSTFRVFSTVSVLHVIDGKVCPDMLVILYDTIYQTKVDLKIVRGLMKDYMDNPRSIIL